MPWYSIVTLVVTILAIPSLVGLFWKDLHDKKKSESEEKKAEEKAKRKEDIREVFCEEVKPLQKQMCDIQQMVIHISNGTLSTLRNDILICYYSCVDKGYRNDYDYTNIHDLYESYRELNGNSFVSDIMERFDKLPTKEEWLKAKEEEKQKKAQTSKSKTKSSPKTNTVKNVIKKEVCTDGI